MKKSDLDVAKLYGKDRAQEDENLNKYFIKTKEYNNIVKGSKEVVLGRKGAGKSALYSYLTSELSGKGDIVVGISPSGEDFVTLHRALDKYKDLDFDNDFKYSLAWQECILLEIAITALNNSANTLERKYPELYKFLMEEKENYGDFVSRLSKAIVNTFENNNITIGSQSWNLSAFTGLLKSDAKKIESQFEKLINDNDVFILVDNLDEPWKNNDTMNSWLRGLVLSTRQLKRKFKRVKTCVFLREDIYDIISKGSDLFDAKNEIMKLNWSTNNNENLLKMVTTRIAVYFGKSEPCTREDMYTLWQLVYPQKYSYMSFKTNEKLLFSYMVDKTFSRPREFLQFCRLLLEHSQDQEIPIGSDCVEEAEYEFSSWKITDLAGEYSKQYKNVDQYIYSLAGVSNNWQFQFSDLDNHFKELDEEEKIYSIEKDKVLTNKESIELLYRIQFFRKVEKRNGKPPKFITSTENRTVSPSRTTFDIHPAFRSCLMSM